MNEQATAPFESAEDVGAFIREHMSGSSFIVYHDGIHAHTVNQASRRWYEAQRDGGPLWIYPVNGAPPYTDEP